MNAQPSFGDLSAVPLDDVLDAVERRLDCRLRRDEGRYSGRNGTAGFPTLAGTWVRLAWRRPERMNTWSWTGLEAADGICGVPRPHWRGSTAWTDEDRGIVWRAEEMTRAADPAVSNTGTIASDPHLPEAWWGELRTALAVLADHRTDRVCVTQEHLTRRIREVYGDGVDTGVTSWSTAHGDLGWANVCGPRLMLLDWESWGSAPVGWDAAALWAASLPVPVVAQKVEETFADVMSTRSGRLSQLLLCANAARAYRRSREKSVLTDQLAHAANGLLDDVG